jgi:hypothetical protein
VGGWGAEQGHDGVADELLHRPAIALQVGPQPGVVGASTARTSSTSSRSDRDVKPTRSQNSTLTRLRSSRLATAGAARGAPQARQNRARSGLSSPQRWQTGMGPIVEAHPKPVHAASRWSEDPPNVEDAGNLGSSMPWHRAHYRVVGRWTYRSSGSGLLRLEPSFLIRGLGCVAGRLGPGHYCHPAVFPGGSSLRWNESTLSVGSGQRLLSGSRQCVGASWATLTTRHLR